MRSVRQGLFLGDVVVSLACRSKNLHGAAPDDRKLEKEYVIEPALGPKSLDGNQSRPLPSTSASVLPGHKRQFGSPVRVQTDMAQATPGQQARPSTLKGTHEPVSHGDGPSNQLTTSEPCLDESAHMATPTVVEYPVAPDDPMMDESPESAALSFDLNEHLKISFMQQECS